MAVTVADTMKQKNGLSFPVVESGDIKGGIHCVATTTERDALIGTQLAQPGMLVYVAAEDDTNKGVTYQLDDTGLTWNKFGGDLDSTQLETILEYVTTNMEGSKYTEEEGVGYLELL